MKGDTRTRRSLPKAARIGLVLLWITAALSAASMAQTPAEEFIARDEDERALTAEEMRGGLAALLEAAARARASGERPEAARLMNRAGRLQVRLFSPEDALTTHRDALSILGQSPDPRTSVDSLNGMGAAYALMSKCGRAEELLRRAVALSERAGYAVGKADALLTLSDCQNYSDHALALRTAQEALGLWLSAGHKRGAAEAYAAISHYQMALHNLAGAAESNEEALRLWRELGRPDLQAEALINLGFIECRKGVWGECLSYLTQAQALLDEKSEPFKMGQITAGLGEAFVESGMPEAGLGKLLEALEHFRRARRPRSVIIISWVIGKTRYMLGDYSEAVATLKTALAELESIEDPTVAAMCHEYLGRTYAATGDTAAALEHYGAALRLYAKVGNRMEGARTNALVGQVYERTGKADAARTLYLSALETFAALGDRVNESAALYALGRLELRRNDLASAEDYLRRSLDITENVRRVSKSSDLAAAVSATLYERYEKYVECLMRMDGERPGMAVRAFETSELARGRSLAELLRATGTDLAPGLDPQLAAREKALRQALLVKEDYKVELLGRAYRKEEIEALEAEQARLGEEYERVAAELRSRHPAYGAVMRPAAWGLRRIQERVVGDGDTVLLEYSLGEDRSYVWAVTRDRINGHELPGRAEIADAAQKVYRLLSSPPSTGGEESLGVATRELSRMILSPVAEELKARRVIVVADGPLNYVPFQILPAREGDAEPLVAGCEVVNAPSATVLGELREEAARRKPATKVLAAFGAPVFASNYALHKGAAGGTQVAAALDSGAGSGQQSMRDVEVAGDTFDPSAVNPLFYAKSELAALREAAGGETYVAADFDATRERLIRTDLSQYAILHFATHGFLDPRRPENSGLVLSTVDRDGRAQNGFVGLKDVYALHAPVDLVVMSACRTALGKQVRGEGLIGLTRGFMYAGASTVVASLWKVDDEATAELMRQFYGNMLGRGMTPAAALRAAQLSIRQRPEWRSPYYWAAFTTQGEFRRVIGPSRAHASVPAFVILLAGGSVLVLLSAAVAWWYRRRRVRL